MSLTTKLQLRINFFAKEQNCSGEMNKCETFLILLAFLPIIFLIYAYHSNWPLVFGAL